MAGTEAPQRIGALRVRWRPNGRAKVPLSRLQSVQAVTIGVFCAVVVMSLAEIGGLQMFFCRGEESSGSCRDLADGHSAYIGIVVVPAGLVTAILVVRHQVARMREANERAEWLRSRLETRRAD